MKKFFIIITLFFISFSNVLSLGYLEGNPKNMSIPILEKKISEFEKELYYNKKILFKDPFNNQIKQEILNYEIKIERYSQILEEKKRFQLKVKIIFYIFITSIIYFTLFVLYKIFMLIRN